MGTKKKDSGKKTQLKSKVEEVSELKYCEVLKHKSIKHLAKAARFCKARKTNRIHARKINPKVPKGAPRPDLSPTRPLALEMSQPRAFTKGVPAALAVTDNIALVRNTELGAVADQNTASPVCEPSVGANENTVFYSGNWFASISTNGGGTFRYVNPYTVFPNPPGMQFCCDQVVQYIKKIDMFIWLLQYTAGPGGGNIQRLAFAPTADVRQGRWRTLDISPQVLGLPASRFLDFPDLALSSKHLFMTTNVYRGNRWDSSVVVRLTLSGIRTGNIQGSLFRSTSNFNFRVTQNSGSTAYFATHVNTSTLRVFSWPDSGQVSSREVRIARYDRSDYRSMTPGPRARNWLGRADDRITAATRSGNEIWFGWSAGRRGSNSRPQPYIQIARIDSRNFQLIENINIWDQNSATAYPALATNSNREVGVSYTIGGGSRFPSMVVAILTGTRRELIANDGTRPPSDHEWGDYCAVRRMSPNEKLFCATGHTFQAGSGSADATPAYLVFGRASDT